MARVEGMVTAAAGRQLGLVALHQLDEAGVARGQRSTWIRQGWLIPVRRGVYRLAGASVTARSDVLAVVLAVGGEAVASHVTAARVWGLGPVLREAIRSERAGRRVEQGSLRAIHVTARRQVRLPGVVGHQRPMPMDERATVGPVPATSLERTMLDLGEMLAPGALGRCIDEALRRGASLERMRELSDRHRGRGRVRRWPAEAALAQRPPGFDAGANDWERRMDDKWDALGLPPSVRQFEVTAAGRCYVLDRAIPELKIGIEWNGFAYHGRRSKFDTDSYRRADLIAAGWELIEVTSTWSADRLCRVVGDVVQRRTAEQRAAAQPSKR